MADDDSPPPPPPSRPPPLYDGEADAVSDSRSSFKSLQQMLAKSSTMYTAPRPAPPPLPMSSPPPPEDNSPKLEHHTRQRPRRKTRAPSRTSLREKASSFIDPFETTVPEHVAPPPSGSVIVEQSQEPLLQPPEIPPPPLPSLSSPPPSPPPSLPPTLSSLKPQTSDDLLSTSLSPTVRIGKTTQSDTIIPGKYHNYMVREPSPAADGVLQAKPLISVVPYKAVSTNAQPSATSTFTNRLKQIRERRAAQKRSPSPSSAPSPSALSPTHSASSLPQYLGPLTESATEDTAGPSSVPLSSLSVSPVTSQASLDSSMLKEVNTDLYSDRGSPNIQAMPAGVLAKPDVEVKENMESSDSSNPPSLPPSPPPSPSSTLLPSLLSSVPPTLSSTIPPLIPPPIQLSPHAPGYSLLQSSDNVEQQAGILVTERTMELAVANKKTDGIEGDSQANKSLESLSDSSESAPELPSEPPPSTPLSTQPVQQPISRPMIDTSAPRRSPHLRDIGRTMRISSESPTPLLSTTSSPKLQSSHGVQPRHYQPLQQAYHQDRRSTFEAMLISESSELEGEKRVSVAERRAQTLKASRRPDAASDQVRKRWSDTDNLFTSGEEVGRTRSALAKLGSNPKGHVTRTQRNTDSNLPKKSNLFTRPEEKSTSNSLLPETLLLQERVTSHVESGGASSEIGDEHVGLRNFEKTEQIALTPLQDKSPVCSPQLNTAENQYRAKEMAGSHERGMAQSAPPPKMLQEHTIEHQTQFTISEADDARETGSDQESWNHPDELEEDPNSWSVDDVCEWLELVGLGTYRDTFREHGVDGSNLLNMDVQYFSELGVDNAEIRELFLSKIYELSHPTQTTGSMQDDFRLEVDSYTEQDWKKLEAAVDALKSPVFRDDIEIDPSAIGQFLHSDYIHSQSTPNIHQLEQQIEEPTFDHVASSYHLPTSVPHSSTVHSFPESNPVREQTAVTDQMRRKAIRAPSTRSIQRQYILTMAEAGDKPRRGHSASSRTTYPGSSVSSQQGSPSISSHNSATDLYTSPTKKGAASASQSAGEGKKKKRRKTAESSPQKHSVPDSLKTLKDLNQGVVVYQQGRYKKMRLGSFLKQTSREPPTESTSALIRLYMNLVQEGLYYKAFLVGVKTTAEQLVTRALERAHIADNPLHFSIWQVAHSNTGESERELGASECPLALQLEWPQMNAFYFQLRLKKDIERIQFQLDLPLCSKTEIQLCLPKSATTTETVQSILGSLGLSDTYSQRGVHCALMDITSRSRPERALAEKECPVSLVKTGHKLKLISISVNKRSSSSGQSDMPALMARLSRLEQEKSILTEQLQSAQTMMRTYMESSMTSESITKPQVSEKNKQSEDNTDGGDEDKAVMHAGEEGIGRLKLLNGALSSQLEEQRMNIGHLTMDKQKLEKNVLELTNRDKELVLEIGLLQSTIKSLKQQLSDSEKSRTQLQQSLDVISRSQPNNDGDADSLQKRLRHAEQEIARLNSSYRDQEARLQVAEQQRQNAIHIVRRLAVKFGQENSITEEEEEEETSEPAGMYKSGKAELVKACREANRELHQHKSYLNQLLSIVIETHPEILTLVSDAQTKRELADNDDSWC